MLYKFIKKSRARLIFFFLHLIKNGLQNTERFQCCSLTRKNLLRTQRLKSEGISRFFFHHFSHTLEIVTRRLFIVVKLNKFIIPMYEITVQRGGERYTFFPSPSNRHCVRVQKIYFLKRRNNFFFFEFLTRMWTSWNIRWFLICFVCKTKSRIENQKNDRPSKITPTGAMSKYYIIIRMIFPGAY